MDYLNRLAFVDIETTGLDPHKDLILEVAIVVITAGGDPDIVSSLSRVVSQPVVASDDYWAKLRPEVQDMHLANGLREATSLSTFSLKSVEDELIDAFTRSGCLVGASPMCGSSVDFDRGFLRVHMPRFAKLFSHRVLDVSSLKQMAYQRKEQAKLPSGGQAKHRALPDVFESIEVYLACLG